MSILHLPLLDDEKWYVITSAQGEEKGTPFWRHGRWSLHGPSTQISAEWNHLSRGFGVGFRLGRNGSESDLGLDLYAGSFGSVWMRLQTPWTRWARIGQGICDDWYYARHSGLRFFPHQGCYFELNVEDRDGSWSKGQPWWRSWSITTSTLLGKNRSEVTEQPGGMAKIPLPEGIYQGAWTEKTYVNYYTRPLGVLRDRLLGPRKHSSIYLEIPGGIPIEGKGENSYDCGMDGLFGCSGRTVQDAVGNAVTAVLRDRERYGGPHNLDRPMTVTEASTR